MPVPATVVTTVAGTHGDSDGVTLPLAVRLAVTDGDAGEVEPVLLRVTLGVTDADAVIETVLLGVTLALALALALAVLLPDGNAVPVREADAVGHRDGDGDALALVEAQTAAMSRVRRRARTAASTA